MRVDVFVEDRAHEELLKALVERLAREEGKSADIRVRSARGGHARALRELRVYQDSVSRGVAGLTMPDLLVVGIDANCSKHSEARERVRAELLPAFRDITVIACPDPHVERWYLGDREGFRAAVGAQPVFKAGKCERDYYKQRLENAVRDADEVPTLGGIEFAREIVLQMNLYRAGKADRSMKAFLDDLSAALRR